MCARRPRRRCRASSRRAFTLFPLALGLGAGAALQRPLAIAVIGRLSVSVFFTRLAAPVLFVALERLKPPRPAAAEEKEFEAVERELAREPAQG